MENLDAENKLALTKKCGRQHCQVNYGLSLSLGFFLSHDIQSYKQTDHYM